MPTTVGLGGVKRNAAVSVAVDGQLAAVCEEGRVQRVRNVGMRAGGFPSAALAAALETAGRAGRSVDAYVVAEPGLGDVCPFDLETVPHHFAHAATTFLTSALPAAAIVVCDTGEDAGVSAWRGDGAAITPVDIEWRGPGFARQYSQVTEWLGFVPGRDEHAVEAVARLGRQGGTGRVAELLRYEGGTIHVAPGFEGYVREAAQTPTPEGMGAVAYAVQSRLGELLLDYLSDVRRITGATSLCVGGGLFFNTHLNTVVRQSGVFDDVFVPVNPGNSGMSAGCALAGDLEARPPVRPATAISPFMGPGYSNEAIKAVLDNCKLTYDFVEESTAIGQAVEALMRGEFVGWFQGRLEWGTRALGNRSIFANPQAPYALENLNRFLKDRKAYRAYGLAVRSEDVSGLFDGPESSPFMECEFEVKDPERFAQVSPPNISHTRVQIVDTDPPALRSLLSAFGEASGLPVLVNTSFNSRHEPVVCSPRDAVRVFYGTGLDMLVIGNFVLRK